MQVKPIVAVLTSRTELLGEIVEFFKDRLGKTDIVGPWHPFIHTNYYEAEMGAGLKRCILSFERSILACELPKLKGWTKEAEEKFSINGKRSVNLDPGYIDLHKVVFASGKGGGHMMALSDGVYVDFLLWYNKGWKPMPWSYPDFKDGTYFEEFENIRKLLKNHLNAGA